MFSSSARLRPVSYISQLLGGGVPRVLTGLLDAGKPVGKRGGGGFPEFGGCERTVFEQELMSWSLPGISQLTTNGATSSRERDIVDTRPRMFVSQTRTRTAATSDETVICQAAI
jgi:hypothetical protein